MDDAEHETSLKLGDVVMLASGSPAMTLADLYREVEDAAMTATLCMWDPEQKNILEFHIPAGALVPATAQ